MFKNLSPRALGFSGTIQSELIELALTHGFRSIDLDMVDFFEQVEDFGIEHSRRLIDSADLKIGTFALPVDLVAEDAHYQKSLEKVPTYGQLAAELGCTRTLVQLLPYSDKTAYPDNFELHRKRLTELGQALAEHDVSIALDFSAPESARKGKQFEFIHDLEATIALINGVAADNVGLLLDPWEVHACGAKFEDVKQLPPNKIVAVYFSDAKSDIPAADLKESDRLFPGESGVIDLLGVIKYLQEIDFEGPVTPKTLRQRVKSTGREVAVQTAGEYLENLWREAGLSAPVGVGVEEGDGQPAAESPAKESE